MSFEAAEDNPRPPWYDLNAPLYDQPNLDEQGVQTQTPKTKQLKWIFGCSEKAKRMKQIIWERGMWVKGMKAKLADDHTEYPELSAQHVLGNCENFR